MTIVDTVDDKGLYRKYRYLMVGDKGINRHLIGAHGWNVHVADFVDSPKSIAEEMSFIEKQDNPFHHTFNAIRKAMNLDTVSFDYSLLNGELVFWEVNPMTAIWDFNPRHLALVNQERVQHRICEAMLSFYLRRATL